MQRRKQRTKGRRETRYRYSEKEEATIVLRELIQKPLRYTKDYMYVYDYIYV